MNGVVRRIKFSTGALIMALGLVFLGIGDSFYWAGKPLYRANRKSRK
jgi:uncharacterized membrane protein